MVVSPFFISALAEFFYDRCAVISGLGVSPTSIWYFRSLCGAKYNACVKIDRAFHALTCVSPFHGCFSRSCVIGAMRLFSVSARL